MQQDKTADRAWTIPEFCRWAQISPASFHRHRELMPATTKIGRSVRITPEARRNWEHDQLDRDQRRSKIG